ncbi:MAG TPA: cytochrome c [Bacillota bacterium]|nr:cytochrome c [Bacillota bacterium]
MKKWLVATLLGSALVLGACGGSDDDAGDSGDSGEDATTETAAAEEIYKKSCASCHGSDLEGGAGPGLENVGSDHSADEIADIIDNGTGSMPAQNLSEEDRDELADWLAAKE